MLPGRLPGAHRYLGGEDFMGYKGLMDTVSITAVVMLQFKYQREGNGSVISVDRRDSGW